MSLMLSMTQKPWGARKDRSSHGSNPISGGIAKASGSGGGIDGCDGGGEDGAVGAGCNVTGIGGDCSVWRAGDSSGWRA